MPTSDLFDDESPDIRKEVEQLVADPETWLRTPHDLLSGQEPGALIGTDQEQRLRDLLRAIKYGMLT